MPVIRHQLTTTLMIFFSELAHCSSIFPIPPIQCNFFECSHSWILKICATYYLGYQTDLVKKKNLYKCRGTFIVIRSTWMSELLYYIPTYYYYILLTRCLVRSTDQIVQMASTSELIENQRIDLAFFKIIPSRFCRASEA